MLETYVRARYTCERFRASPAGPYLDGFASWLKRTFDSSAGLKWSRLFPLALLRA
jgi:hypothetical protein